MGHFIMVDGVSGLPGGITFTDSGTTNGGTYNFGTSGTNRFIAAAMSPAMTGTTPGVSAVSIGGVSATLVARSVVGTNPNAATAEIWIAAVPTGTSGVISITSSPSLVSIWLGVYSLAMSSITAFATATNSVFNFTDTVNISVPTNGLVLGINHSITSGSISWSGVSKDAAFQQATNNWGSSGHIGPIASTTLTVGTNISGGITPSQGLAVASWSP